MPANKHGAACRIGHVQPPAQADGQYQQAAADDAVEKVRQLQDRQGNEPDQPLEATADGRQGAGKEQDGAGGQGGQGKKLRHQDGNDALHAGCQSGNALPAVGAVRER